MRRDSYFTFDGWQFPISWVAGNWMACGMRCRENGSGDPTGTTGKDLFDVSWDNHDESIKGLNYRNNCNCNACPVNQPLKGL